MKKKLILMACLGMCALALAACGKEKTGEAGKEMSAEELRAYRDRLAAEAETASTDDTPAEAPVETDVTAEETTEADDLVCFYTEKGTKWHVRENCQYLKNSKEIMVGDPESAAAAGKVTPCSACAAAYIED